MGETVLFRVVRSQEGRYAVWWASQSVPDGWVAVTEPADEDAAVEAAGRMWEADARALRLEC